MLANKAKRRYVAVAYLGAGATKLLPLAQGDVLIVNMSLEAVRNHQVSLAEIEEYLESGVEIHSCSNLHAKVFVFDDTAIVGSTNASINSRDHLIEAALLTTTNKAVVDSVRNFILSLKGERVTPAYVEACKQLPPSPCPPRPPSVPPPPPPSPSVRGKIQIRLKAYDHRILDQTASRIVEAAESNGSRVIGPVLLPTKRCSQQELLVHMRRLEVVNPTKGTLNVLQSLSLPAGVDVEMKTLSKSQRRPVRKR